MNKIPKILGIFLKISGLMENPDPGNDINKATVPNTLSIMTLMNNNSKHWGGKKIRRIPGGEIRKLPGGFLTQGNGRCRNRPDPFMQSYPA